MRASTRLRALTAQAAIVREGTERLFNERPSRATLAARDMAIRVEQEIRMAYVLAKASEEGRRDVPKPVYAAVW